MKAHNMTLHCICCWDILHAAIAYSFSVSHVAIAFLGVYLRTFDFDQCPTAPRCGFLLNLLRDTGMCLHQNRENPEFELILPFPPNPNGASLGGGGQVPRLKGRPKASILRSAM